MKKWLILMVLVALTAVAGQLIDTQTIGDTSHVPYRVIRARPLKLFTILGYNSGPAQFIMIFESTNAPPTNGQIGKFSFPVGATQGFSFDMSAYGSDLDAVVVANSTTDTNLTFGATNCSFQGVIAR